MSFLMTHLPPFAADYSGVAAALHDLGGLVVIHDASGCTGSYTGYDEPRWFESRSGVFCSGLRELDAIMGQDDKLLDNIRRAVAGRDYRFVAVVASPVPMLVGFDVDGFAHLVEHEIGLPAFGFPTTGLRLYHDGLAAAFLTLARRFVADPEAAPAGANILGASPLDNIDADDVARLAGLLDRAGLAAVSVWGQGSDLAGLERAAGAAVNLVVAAAALPLARFMARRWGIPFVTALPIEAEDEAEIAAALARAAAGGAPPAPTASPSTTPAVTAPAADAPVAGAPIAGAPITGAGTGGPRTTLVGEQVAMRALRAALRRRRPEARVRVASFFAWDGGLAEPGDQHLADEEAAIAWLGADAADVVVGDPLLAALLPAGTRLVALPHRGISGRLDRRAASAAPGAAEVVREVAALWSPARGRPVTA